MKYLIVVFVVVLFGLPQQSFAKDKGATTDATAGKKLAFNRKKGNCLACHKIGDGKLTGNSGPPLVAMKGRFPDKSALRAQIWDASVINKYTVISFTSNTSRHVIRTTRRTAHIIPRCITVGTKLPLIC